MTELILIRHVAGMLLIMAAMPFFLAGMLGLLRFPDVYTRIHAVTKADNVGLGLVVAGLILHNWSIAIGAKLLLIWVLVLGASATGSHLVGAAAVRQQVKLTLSARSGSTTKPRS